MILCVYSLAKKGSNNELEVNDDALKLTVNYVIFKRPEISLLEKIRQNIVDCI